ncbi:FkbM family methyltransferase [bacterium]|nr:FkbM family methyltransferase [bacterium]
MNRQTYLLKFYPSSYSRALWIEPNFRLDQEIFYLQYLKKGDIVIDIGANIGTITITSATQIGNNGTVYSIEAHPKIFQYLKGNVKHNNLTNVNLFNYAVGNKSGNVFFSNLSSDGQNKIIDNDQGTKIPLIKIDDLNIPESNIHLFKIDVEGYEKFAFLGSNNVLKKTSCVLFEAVPKNFENYNYSFTDIYHILNSYNFKIYRFLEHKKISLISHDYIPQNEDLIAIKNPDDFIDRTNYEIIN